MCTRMIDTDGDFLKVCTSQVSTRIISCFLQRKEYNVMASQDCNERGMRWALHLVLSSIKNGSSALKEA